MAAYAALVSLMHIIDQIQNHPRPPISLDKIQVESLTEKVTFLQDFLECYSHGGDSKEADGLERRIGDAAYAAEDIVESRIVDQILAESTSHAEKMSSIDFYEGLQKVIDNMEFIKKEAMETTKKIEIHNFHINSTPEDSRRSSFTGQNIMVGFDDVLIEIMDKLTGQQSNRQIIPIVGMGGMGKTTLARNVYLNPLIQHHFDICAWTTISQGYSTREILKEVLCQSNKEGHGVFSEMSEDELGETLHKYLSGRRYLIVMDDVWSIEAWDKIKFFFPDCNNGSRMVVTTRISNLAFQLADSTCLQMKFLDVDKSWNLLCKIVFGEESCPLELEKTGKKIAKGCKGLPLSIAVIGGLLAKSKHKWKYWEYIAENLSSVVNLENNERCLRILYMSYNELPIYLKPCFLYVGVFPEDRAIRASVLIKEWVAEGFLRPIRGKSLEVLAKEHLKDLVDRNLILVHELGSTGNIKYCKIHDLLRDLCLREAHKEGFYSVTRQHSHKAPQGINIYRRQLPEGNFLDALKSMPLARSLICYSRSFPPLLNFRLLRILKTFDKDYSWGDSYYLEKMFHLVNLRHIAVSAKRNSVLCSSIYRLWNLHTLIVSHSQKVIIAQFEIWKMPQLRHVKVNALDLPDPPSSDHMDGNDFVLGNLQTLSNIRNFNCSEEIIVRIPNIKKLKVFYDASESSCYFLNNIERLHKLESFGCSAIPSIPDYLQNLTFPYSLKKLTISQFHSGDILENIGSLPLLEKLRLRHVSFKNGGWETIEGQFCSLKSLRIDVSFNLGYWKTDSTHFPRLERLVLCGVFDLKEIPSCIGEIPTLQSIHLIACNDSVIVSAKKVLEEHEELGNVGLQVRVSIMGADNALKSLASRNFQVDCR